MKSGVIVIDAPDAPADAVLESISVPLSTTVVPDVLKSFRSLIPILLLNVPLLLVAVKVILLPLTDAESFIHIPSVVEPYQVAPLLTERL